MAATIYDIAKKAKVSYSTASRVLNGDNYGKRSDSLKRAKEILRIAEAEGYQAHSAAQALVGKSSKNICLLISDHIQSGWGNAYFSQVLEGVEQTCHEHNYGLVLNSYKTDDFGEFFTRRKLAGRGFDGIVIAGYVTSEMGGKLRQHQVPFISINKHFENTDNIPAFYSDGSELAIVQFAYQCGHRKIGFVAENLYPDIQQIQRKVEANGLSDCRIVPIPIAVPGDFQSAAAVMASFLKLGRNDRPTLIAGNYQTCAALLKELKKHGMCCPADLSLISRCESEVCRVTDPELTVVAPNIEQVGMVATKRLIDFLENKTPLAYERSNLENTVIERQSVKIINP